MRKRAPKPAYNLGDSLGLLGLILGGLAFLLKPPLWANLLLFLLCLLGCVVFVFSSHWTHSWRKNSKLVASFVTVVLLSVIGIPQFMAQAAAKAHPAVEKGEVAPPQRPPIRSQPELAARWREKYAPYSLTLQDLFLIDTNKASQSDTGWAFVRVRNGSQFDIEYSIVVDLAARTKYLSFYIPSTDATAYICANLAQQYKFFLDKAPQLLITEKGPGDSGATSTAETIFSGRIYIYHVTYLASAEIVELTKAYERRNLSVIFRDLDYLTNKKMAAKIRQLRSRP